VVAKRTSSTWSQPRWRSSDESICSSRTPVSPSTVGVDTPTDKRQKIIDVNLMSEVFAAK
jgi:hypothetical protein